MPKIFKADLRTFLEDVGTSRVLNERPILKCGEKPRLVDQTPVLGTRDLRFCYQKSGCARKFPIFPRAYDSGDKKPTAPKRKRDNIQ